MVGATSPDGSPNTCRVDLGHLHTELAEHLEVGDVVRDLHVLAEVGDELLAAARAIELAPRDLLFGEPFVGHLRLHGRSQVEEIVLVLRDLEVDREHAPIMIRIAPVLCDELLKLSARRRLICKRELPEVSHGKHAAHRLGIKRGHIHLDDPSHLFAAIVARAEVVVGASVRVEGHAETPSNVLVEGLQKLEATVAGAEHLDFRFATLKLSHQSMKGDRGHRDAMHRVYLKLAPKGVAEP